MHYSFDIWQTQSQHMDNLRLTADKRKANKWQTNSSSLCRYLFGVVRVLLYSMIEFLCPQKDVI